MNEQLQRIQTHHWLKHPDEEVFHAYMKVKVGSKTICGEGRGIQELTEMDIPGSRSTCCLSCYRALYGVDPYTLSEK